MFAFVPSVAHGNMTLAAAPTAAVSTSAVVWQGRETLAGYGALSFVLDNNGTATMNDAKGRSAGT